MLCDHVKPQLNALVDGELSALRTWRVRRHLRNCPACAREYAAIKHIETLTRSWAEATDVSVPITLRNFVQNNAAVPNVSTPRPITQKMPHKMVRVLPAIIVASALICAPFLLKRESDPTLRPTSGVAFAEVEAAVDRVQTFHCVTHSEWQGTVRELSQKRDELLQKRNATENEDWQIWVKTNPAAFALVSTNAGTKYWFFNFRIPVSKPIYTVVRPFSRIIGDSTGVVKYVQGKKPERITTLPVTRATIQQEMLNTMLGKEAAYFKTGKSTLVRDEKGRTLLCFSRTKKEQQGEKGQVVDMAMHSTLWVDPATRLPVRCNVEWQTDSMTVHSRSITRTDFFYNQTPPAGVFAPPQNHAGKK